MLLVGLVRWGACSEPDVVDAAAAASSSRLFSLSDVDIDDAMLRMRITRRANKAAAELCTRVAGWCLSSLFAVQSVSID